MLGYALPVGCGQCIPCLVNRRRTWAHRQVLESFKHEDNSFVTLTYDQEHVGAGELVPAHMRDWLKRLRFAIYPVKVRFFGVGEYGEETWRPHYHLSLFGYGLGKTVDSASQAAKLIGQTWGMGNVYIAEFNAQTASYVAGYVTKKMTAAGDWRLDGRAPEFARMSRRPGLGAPALDDIVATARALKLNDAPRFLQMGSQRLVLGRYLRRLVREAMLSGERIEEIKQEWVDETQEKMFGLLAAARRDQKSFLTARQVLVASRMGRILSIEARQKLKRRVNL